MVEYEVVARTRYLQGRLRDGTPEASLDVRLDPYGLYLRRLEACCAAFEAWMDYEKEILETGVFLPNFRNVLAIPAIFRQVRAARGADVQSISSSDASSHASVTLLGASPPGTPPTRPRKRRRTAPAPQSPNNVVPSPSSRSEHVSDNGPTRRHLPSEDISDGDLAAMEYEAEAATLGARPTSPPILSCCRCYLDFIVGPDWFIFDNFRQEAPI